MALGRRKTRLRQYDPTKRFYPRAGQGVNKANDKALKKETQPEDSTSTGNQGQQIWPVPTTIADATPEETVMGIKTKMTGSRGMAKLTSVKCHQSIRSFTFLPRC